MLLVFDTSIWFTLPPRIGGEAFLLNLCLKFAKPCWHKEKFCYKKALFQYFCQSSLVFYLDFLFQLQLEKGLLLDQDLIFQSKQILNWLKKKRIWLFNFSSDLFVEQKISDFSTFGQRFFVAEIRELIFILSLIRMRLTWFGDNLSSER